MSITKTKMKEYENKLKMVLGLSPMDRETLFNKLGYKKTIRKNKIIYKKGDCVFTITEDY